mgnify:CR=1 FL=1
MIPQTTAAILLAVPLGVVAIVSVRYWTEFQKNNKSGTGKQKIPYNRIFQLLLGFGYFCLWPLWIGGTLLLFLNRYDGIFGFLTLPSPLTRVIQIVGFLVFYAGAMLLNWAIASAGKYLRPSIAGVYEDHKLVQTGPLGVVRHPYYVSYVFLLVGLSLALLSWLPLIPALCVVIGMVPTAKTEEVMLQERFAEEYGDAHPQSTDKITKIGGLRKWA